MWASFIGSRCLVDVEADTPLQTDIISRFGVHRSVLYLVRSFVRTFVRDAFSPLRPKRHLPSVFRRTSFLPSRDPRLD